MAPEENNKRNRLLWDFDDVLWGLLKREATKRKRSAPRQLEEILQERYRPDALSREEVEEALRLASTRDASNDKMGPRIAAIRDRKADAIEPTPKKTAKKQANGPKKR